MIDSLKKVRGAYSLLILADDGLFGMRDPHGSPPLCLGKLGDSWVLASETCAFDIVDAKYVRDVEPGEIVLINENGLVSIKPFEKTASAMCIFEHIYFARPDSRIYNTSVQKVRKNWEGCWPKNVRPTPTWWFRFPIRPTWPQRVTRKNPKFPMKWGSYAIITWAALLLSQTRPFGISAPV